jgi:type IV pilus assembly protein PilF
MAKLNNDFLNLKGCFISALVFFLTACAATDGRDKEKRGTEVQLYIDLGLRYLEMGDYRVALTKLKKAHAVDDENFSSHNALAIFFDTTGKKELAVSHYKRALSLAPDNPRVLNNYGRFLCQHGDIDNGFEMLIKAAKLPLNNRSWLSYSNAGRCQLIKGNQRLAEKNFLQAIAQNNSFAPALFELATLNYARQEFLSARNYIEQFITVNSETAASVLLAYKIERQLGRLTVAEHYHQILKKNFPASRETQSLVNKE